MNTAYLFKTGRKKRLPAARETGPSEFFYGFIEHERAGRPVTLLEEIDVGIVGARNAITKAISHACDHYFGINASVVSQIMRRRDRDRLDQYDTVIATTNLLSVTLGLAKRLRLLDTRVIAICMGVIPQHASWIERKIILWALRGTTVAVISRGEEDYLNKISQSRLDLRYVPFGVDKRFWTVGENQSGSTGRNYVISIGNDSQRDYATLIKAWKPDFPHLKILTHLPVDSSADNVEVISSDWHRNVLTDEDIRELLQGALMVVLPIRRTIQPSGQSVCLQAMACGKAVVISDIEGLWDRDAMTNGRNCVLVRPEDPAALSMAIAGLLEDRMRLRALGCEARQTIQSVFNTDIMADRFGDLMASVSSRGQ